MNEKKDGLNTNKHAHTPTTSKWSCCCYQQLVLICFALQRSKQLFGRWDGTPLPVCSSPIRWRLSIRPRVNAHVYRCFTRVFKWSLCGWNYCCCDKRSCCCCCLGYFGAISSFASCKELCLAFISIAIVKVIAQSTRMRIASNKKLRSLTAAAAATATNRHIDRHL